MAKQIGHLGLKTKSINSKEQDIFHSIRVRISLTPYFPIPPILINNAQEGIT